MDLSSKYIKEYSGYENFDLGIICGSGLNGISSSLEEKIMIPYSNIPEMPVSSVKGHPNIVSIGKMGIKNVICFEGRKHLYEGITYDLAIQPIAIMVCLGVKIIFVTNSSGGLNLKYNLGDIMQISDHIDLPGLCGHNLFVYPTTQCFPPPKPFAGKGRPKGYYDKELSTLCKYSFRRLGFSDFYRERGTYCMVMGPAYETSAESHLIAQGFGADAIGASTVPEILAASEAGVRVCALSVITGVCSTRDEESSATQHEEVLGVASIRAVQIGQVFRDMANCL